jgi:type II secretory pathway pseudopilin PulG
MKETKRGISLIVLIITIVVMLILVSIIVMSFSKSNPISKASEVKFKSDVKGFREELLATHASKAYDNLSYKKENVNISLDNYSEMKEYIEDISEKWCKKLYISKGELVYGGTDETEKKWFEDVVNGNFDGSNNGGSSDGSTTTDSNVKTEWKQYIGKVTSDGVPIPKGFDYVTGTKDTGVVIKDQNTGNEFVWIAVDSINSYKKKEGELPSTSLDTLPSGVSDAKTDVQKYGGFYIGRYECGIPINDSSAKDGIGVPTVQKDRTVWNNISYKNAKDSAEGLYNQVSNSVISGLMSAIDWDTTCVYISDKVLSITNSRSYGNYSDSTTPANVDGYGSIKTTGYSEIWKVKNIYDLAGNVGEWVAAVCINNGDRGICGGSYSNSGSSSSVTSRYVNDSFWKNVGFRIRLYIK